MESFFNDYFPPTWLVLGLVTLVLLRYLLNWSNQCLPPSPAGALPVLGHMHLVGKDPRPKFSQWADELGPMFTVKLGTAKIVVLNTLEIMKETLVKKADYFSDRPELYFNTKANDGNLGIVWSNGANWKEQRATVLSILRHFGMGKNIMAENIEKEVTEYIQAVSAHEGRPCNIGRMTSSAVSNVICAVIFGQRFEYDNPEFLKMVNGVNAGVKVMVGTAAAAMFPVLLKLLSFFSSKPVNERRKNIGGFLNKIIEKEKARFNPDEEQLNLIAAYLLDKHKKEKAGIETTHSDGNLRRGIGNLFAAGTETSSSTIQWCVLYALYHPEIQEKVHQEIVDRVGTQRFPSIHDKNKLNYLNAFILECQRMGTVAPLGVPHVCNADVTVRGYLIPKGTQIYTHLNHVHKSKDVWGDPENFRPERFLDSDGNLLLREEIMPFSIGRRICLGESLAKMELFMFIAALFQTFRFLPVDPKALPPLKSQFGLTCAPYPYEVRCVKRDP